MEQQLQDIENAIKQYKEILELKEALHRLADTDDFKLVFNTAYFVDELVRLTMLKGASITKEQYERIDRMILGIVALKGFFAHVDENGEMAETGLIDAKEARVEILAEG